MQDCNHTEWANIWTSWLQQENNLHKATLPALHQSVVSESWADHKGDRKQWKHTTWPQPSSSSSSSSGSSGSTPLGRHSQPNNSIRKIHMSQKPCSTNLSEAKHYHHLSEESVCIVYSQRLFHCPQPLQLICCNMLTVSPCWNGPNWKLQFRPDFEGGCPHRVYRSLLPDCKSTDSTLCKWRAPSSNCKSTDSTLCKWRVPSSNCKSTDSTLCKLQCSDISRLWRNRTCKFAKSILSPLPPQLPPLTLLPCKYWDSYPSVPLHCSRGL